MRSVKEVALFCPQDAGPSPAKTAPLASKLSISAGDGHLLVKIKSSLLPTSSQSVTDAARVSPTLLPGAPRCTGQKLAELARKSAFLSKGVTSGTIRLLCSAAQGRFFSLLLDLLPNFLSIPFGNDSLREMLGPIP